MKRKFFLIAMALVGFAPAVANADNLIVGDSSDRTLYEFTQQGGEFLGAFVGSNNLVEPSGIAVHPVTQDLFVSDLVRGDVRHFDGSTGSFRGVFGTTGQDLTDPVGLEFHPTTNNLLVADRIHGEVREFDGTTGDFIGTFGTTGTNVSSPRDVKFHPVTGQLFVPDIGNGDVRQFNATTGEFIGIFGDTSVNLTSPQGIAFHPVTGNLFVADVTHVDIREFDGTSGSFIGIFGTTASNLIRPIDLTFFRPTGSLLVADREGGDVVEFDGTTGALLGVFGETGDNLSSPSALAFLPDNANPVSFDRSAFNVPSGNRVVSPFWQAGETAYTFLAISHPSFEPVMSRLGLNLYAVMEDASTLYGKALEFTVEGGTTRQVFITEANHPTLHAGNLPNALFITGSTALSHGQLLMSPVGTSDITQLVFWGSVVADDSLTGFAMEFVGDVQDSRAFNTPNTSGVN